MWSHEHAAAHVYCTCIQHAVLQPSVPPFVDQQHTACAGWQTTAGPAATLCYKALAAHL